MDQLAREEKTGGRAIRTSLEEYCEFCVTRKLWWFESYISKIVLERNKPEIFEDTSCCLVVRGFRQPD